LPLIALLLRSTAAKSLGRFYQPLRIVFVNLWMRLGRLHKSKDRLLNHLQAVMEPFVWMTFGWGLSHRKTPPQRVTILTNMARPKKDLEPLAPMHDLKAVVRGLIAFPKELLNEIEASRPKRKRSPKKPA